MTIGPKTQTQTALNSSQTASIPTGSNTVIASASSKNSSHSALPLISPKPFSEYSPKEYRAYIQSHYELRQKGSKPAKPKGPAEGLTLKRTKKGALSVLRNKRLRAWEFVTRAELHALAKEAAAPVSEVWNYFTAKGYVIGDDKVDCERINVRLKEMTW